MVASDRILCAHLMAILLLLKLLEPPAKGKSIEFPRKHAILADCTIIT